MLTGCTPPLGGSLPSIRVGSHITQQKPTANIMSNNDATATAVGVAALDATAVDGDDDAAMISIQQHKKRH
jgi:hypothetical protein